MIGREVLLLASVHGGASLAADALRIAKEVLAGRQRRNAENLFQYEKARVRTGAAGTLSAWKRSVRRTACALPRRRA